MNGRAKLGAALIFLGLLLLFGAFGLWQSNRGEALEAEEQSRAVMRQLAPAIAERAENPAHLQPAAAEGASSAADPTMDTVEVDGRLYVGFLTVPDLGLELPVMADWDYDLLKIAPCRYSVLNYPVDAKTATWVSSSRPSAASTRPSKSPRINSLSNSRRSPLSCRKISIS